ncbi:hypothetical protein MALH07_00402 [Mycoplasma anatis]|nr:hypothetical protein [Mycoplasmopsis anatis]MBW0599853.1 hypothetical protein [Mycoplasmopsis anatis]MBW0600537.1 hypothetical protein [Mycoplasmopsis anatis]MBW0601286.1 hypothetical protein [Mycoplasmopsis anatis]
MSTYLLFLSFGSKEWVSYINISACGSVFDALDVLAENDDKTAREVAKVISKGINTFLMFFLIPCFFINTFNFFVCDSFL